MSDDVQTNLIVCSRPQQLRPLSRSPPSPPGSQRRQPSCGERLSFCPLFFGMLQYIHPSILFDVHCSCFLFKLYLAILNKNSRRRTALQHLGTSKHGSCIEEAFRNLTRDQIQNWLSKTSQRTKHRFAYSPLAYAVVRPVGSTEPSVAL